MIIALALVVLSFVGPMLFPQYGLACFVVCFSLAALHATFSKPKPGPWM